MSFSQQKDTEVFAKMNSNEDLIGINVEKIDHHEGSKCDYNSTILAVT